MISAVDILLDQLASANIRSIEAKQMRAVKEMTLTQEMGQLNEHFLGQHVLAEFNTGLHHLTAVELEEVVRGAAQAANATILTSKFFDNMASSGGISGIVVIEESHFSVHYLPEHHFIAFDAFTCGNKIKMQVAIDQITQRINAKPYDEVEIKRGIHKVVDGNIMKGRFVPGIAQLQDKTLSFLDGTPKHQPNFNIIGDHLIAELYFCHPSRINDGDFVLSTFLDALQVNQQDEHFGFVHQFQPQGVSAVVMGDGYHLTVHDWPEYAYAAIDLCVLDHPRKRFNAEAAMQRICEEFQSQKTAIYHFQRGVYCTEQQALTPAFHYASSSVG